MLLDWFTVAAQMINFLILVALLKYFLYGRIIQAMDERQQGIDARLAETEKQRQEAEQTAAAYRHAQQALEDQRAEVLAQAREEAAAQRQALYDQARADVEQRQARWHAAMQQEQAAFLQALRQRASQQLTAIARRALTDLAHADLEQAILTAFLEQLRRLEPAVWHRLASALQGTAQPALIRSAFTLPATARQQVQQILQEHLGEDLHLRFETSPAILCGIELQTNGQKLAWSFAHYVSTLEEQLGAAFAEETGAPLVAAAANANHPDGGAR